MSEVSSKLDALAYFFAPLLLEGQMALIKVNLATMEQVFLPYAILPDGRTVYERLRGQRFALPPHEAAGP